MSEHSDPVERAPDEAERRRLMHERSGEIELLISGALVFGLFQVPPHLDRLWDGLWPTLGSGDGFALFFAAFFYVKLSIFVLIGSFGLHLITRGYWVGVVGLDSVFPDGIDWDRINYGPIAKAEYRKRIPSLSEMARKADDFGSSIFSVSFMVVFIFVLSIAAGAAVGGVGLGLKRTVLPGLQLRHLFFALFALALVPGLALGIDRLLDGRIASDGRGARAIRGVVKWAGRISLGRVIYPIQFTIFSRLKKTVVWPLWVGGGTALVVAFSAAEFFRMGAFGFSSTDLFPNRHGARSVHLDRYANTREPHSVVPYIQADIIEGPYARLTVPLRPSWFEERLEQVCPSLGRVGTTGIVSRRRIDSTELDEEAAVLDCLAASVRVRVDGAPVDLDWDFLWTGRASPQAMVAYVPVSDLPPGRHTLEVERVPVDPDDEGAAEAAAEDGEDDSGEHGPLVFIRFVT